MIACKKLFLFLGSLVGIGLFIGNASTVRAVDYYTPTMDINGNEIYDGDTQMVFDDELPAGVTFDPASYTVTLTNVNTTVLSDTAFIESNSYGGGQTYDLHIKLVGSNTITCEENPDGEYHEEIFHNNGNMIFEGTGSLTIKNNISGMVDLHDSDRRDLTIKDCTINCSNGSVEGYDIFDLNNMTLENCVLTTDYDNTREGDVAYIEGRLIMNNATWKLNTSGVEGTYNKTSISPRNNAEFHNSTCIVTGDHFWGFDMLSGDVIFDNSTFLGKGEFWGINGGESLTYYNFVTKHQCFDSYGNKIICSGKYSAIDLHPYFDITPYTGSDQSGNNSNGKSGNGTSGNPVPTTPVWFNNVGSTVKTGTGNYTITSYSEVEYKTPVSKNSSKITIPDTVTISGHKYNVTTIAKNAFKSNKKLKTLVIGKNIKKIGVKAFYNCKALKKITIKTSKLTLKSIGKNAFKGTAKKATVKVPKKKLKLYKKILKKRGLSKKAKIK